MKAAVLKAPLQILVYKDEVSMSISGCFRGVFGLYGAHFRRERTGNAWKHLVLDRTTRGMTPEHSEVRYELNRESQSGALFFSQKKRGLD